MDVVTVPAITFSSLVFKDNNLFVSAMSSDAAYDFRIFQVRLSKIDLFTRDDLFDITKAKRVLGFAPRVVVVGVRPAPSGPLLRIRLLLTRGRRALESSIASEAVRLAFPQHGVRG